MLIKNNHNSINYIKIRSHNAFISGLELEMLEYIKQILIIKLKWLIN